MPKLTVSMVDALGKPDRDTLLMDDTQKGFGLRLTPSGSRLFLVRKRHAGETIKRTFGQMASTGGKLSPALPVLTIKEARTEAAKILGLIAGGQPLDAVREPEKPEEHIETFKDVSDRWMRQHVIPKLKATTRADYQQISKALCARFGDRPFSSITRGDVLDLHAEMKDRPRRANYYLQVISAVANFIDAPKNPAAKIAKYRENKRERILNSDELVSVLDAIATLERDRKLSVWACQALRFAIATGARPSEIRAIEWSFVDFERQRVVLPDSKANRTRIIYTNSIAWAIITSTERYGKFVFAGHHKNTPYQNLGRAWEKARKLVGLDDVRLYDARHTFASEAAKAGHNLPMIGALLGHTVAATTARYVHLVDDPVARASQSVGDAMTAAAAKRATTPNVVPLKRKARR